MKKEKLRKVLIARLPMEAVLIMRGKGGAQTTRSGKRGYDRSREKSNLRREF